MIKRSNFYHKLLSGFTAFLLILQSFAPTLVFAQVVTDNGTLGPDSTAVVSDTTPSTTSLTQDPTPTQPATESTQQETVSPSPGPTEEPTATPIPTSTPKASVEPTPQPLPEVSPQPLPDVSLDQPTNIKASSSTTENQPLEDQVESTPQPTETVGQPNAPPQESPNPSSTPEPTPTVDVQETSKGHLSATILENTDASSLELDLSTQKDISSATLVTDKADYAPTDTAVITGKDFPKVSVLKLIITVENYRFEKSVQTDENGSFFYLYQLDGTYRPLYIVEAYDLSGTLLATVSFTDAPPSGGSFTYTLQGLISGQDPNNESSWSKGNLCQGGGSCYTEGEGIPARLTITGLTPGVTYSVVVQHDYDDGAGHLGYLSFSNTSTVRPDEGATNTTITFINNVPCGGGVTCKNYELKFSATGSIATVYWNSILGLDAAEWNGASLHFRLESGIGGENVGNKEGPVQVSQILFLPSMTLTKIVDSGSATPDQWCFSVTPSIKEISQFCIPQGQNSVTVSNISNGSYTITETGPSSYIFASGNGTNCTFSGSQATATVASGDPAQNATCIFHNGLNEGTIVVHKDVQGPNGETITDTSNNFTVRLDGASPKSFTDGGTVTYNNVALGTHTVTEDTPPSGYSLFGISPDSDGTVTGAQVTVTAGQTTDVFVVNRQQKTHLTVIKHVVNDNGGIKAASDFTISVTGNNVSPSSFPGSEIGTTITLNQGLYSVDEVNVAGYTKSLSTDCSGIIGVGEEKTCSVTNNDQQAKLIVIKHVVNDNGGNAQASDFTMNVTGTNASDPSFPGNENGTQVTLDAGSYSVDENPQAGYSKTLGQNCSGTISNGETKTCTITNDDQTASITLIKMVTINNGGNAQPDNFDLTIDGQLVLSGSTTQVGANQPHTINETNLSGYLFISITGNNKCPQTLGGTVTLNEGEHITCIISNDDVAPTITLIKNVINDNGGNASPNDFSLTIGGTTVLSGAVTPVLANIAIAINETLLSGYSFVSISGSAKCPVILGGTFTLDEGENITCTITNNDVAPTITLIKQVINDKGGTATANDFGLSVGGTPVTSGQTVSVPANTPMVINETAVAGYKFVSITGDAKCPQTLGGTVTLDEGESITCTITNAQDTGTITVIKDVVPNDQSLWNISVSGTASSSTTLSDGQSSGALTLPTGSYTVTESPANQAEDGYTSSFTCVAGGVQITNGSGRSINLNLESNQNIICTFTNELIPSTLTLTKTNDRLGISVPPGSDVIYTLTVALTGAPVKNVSLVDLLPDGFTYRAGSWSANSNIRGDLKGQDITPEAKYASPAIWQLGNMIAGEVVTLTLIADIKEDIDLGLYKDLSWSKGTGLVSEVLANETNGIFVGTEVNVGKEPQGTSYAVAEKIKEEIKEEKVLGVSAQLPQTGANTVWVMLASSLLIVGFELLFIGIILRRKKHA